MPTVIVGGTAVQSTTATTSERLSATGVTFPEFVSKEYVDGPLKAVQSEFKKMFSEDLAFIRRAITGKGVASSAPPPTPQIRLPQPTPNPTVQNMSVEALKAALLDKLLNESNVDASSEADLVSILRLQSQLPPPITPTDSSRDSITAKLSEVTKALEKLTERVSSLEDTCKGQVQSSKRHHDDQDDPDQHEGEKRMRLTELSSAATETTTVTSTEPQQQQQPSESKMVQDMEISTPVRDSLLESADPTVEKPDGPPEDTLLSTVPERPVLELELIGKTKSNLRLAVKKKTAAKGKAAKDPNKPKRPASAFFVFMEEFWKQFKEENPGNKSIVAVGKAGAAKWKTMSDSEKAPYVAKVDKRKKEYEKNMDSYNKKLEGGDKEEDDESDKSKSEVHDEEDE